MARITDSEHDVSVGSRVSWGAILAGAAIAFAVYFLLNLLGTAVGLSVSDRADRDTLGTSAAIWAILSVIVALFLGGWATSRFTVGEDRTEAVLNGAILWGVSFVLLLWMVSLGLSAGYGAMIRASTSEPTAAAPTVASDGTVAPRTTEGARDAATRVAWWAFAGTLLSMASSIGGALLGSQRDFMGGHRVWLSRTAHGPATG